MQIAMFTSLLVYIDKIFTNKVHVTCRHAYPNFISQTDNTLDCKNAEIMRCDVASRNGCRCRCVTSMPRLVQCVRDLLEYFHRVGRDVSKVQEARCCRQPRTYSMCYQAAHGAHSRCTPATQRKQQLYCRVSLQHQPASLLGSLNIDSHWIHTAPGVVHNWVGPNARSRTVGKDAPDACALMWAAKCPTRCPNLRHASRLRQGNGAITPKTCLARQ